MTLNKSYMFLPFVEMHRPRLRTQWNDILLFRFPSSLSDLIDVYIHYNDVIMGAIASQITSLTIVYSTVYSGADQSKHQSSASLAFARGNHRDRWIIAQMASNAENVSIWWRHHVIRCEWQCERDSHFQVASSRPERIIRLVYCSTPSRDKCAAFSA